MSPRSVPDVQTLAALVAAPISAGPVQAVINASAEMSAPLVINLMLFIKPPTP